MKLKPRSDDAIIPKILLLVIFVFSFSYLVTLSGLYLIYFNGVLPLNSVNLEGFSSFIVLLNPLDPSSPVSLDHAKARTMLITTMYLTESFIVLSIRRINRSFMKSAKDLNLFSWLMILLGPLIHFLVLFVPTVQARLLDRNLSLDFVPLSVTDFLIAVIFSIIPLIILETIKLLLRKRNRQL